MRRGRRSTGRGQTRDVRKVVGSWRLYSIEIRQHGSRRCQALCGAERSSLRPPSTGQELERPRLQDQPVGMSPPVELLERGGLLLAQEEAQVLGQVSQHVG